jgi:hypothetical protein
MTDATELMSEGGCDCREIRYRMIGRRCSCFLLSLSLVPA